MQAAPARYVSVSELYATDEVELLLDEIRELEPTSCRGEDLQDFEIAGSGCGVGAGGRSPGAESLARSWDSHAQYRREPPRAAPAPARLYCRPRHLLSLRGAATLLLVLWCVCACGCVWGALGWRGARAGVAGVSGAAGGAGGAAGRLGAAARPLLLGALSSALLHALLLVLHVTRLAHQMPLDWNKMALVCAAWSAAWLAAGGALVLRAAAETSPLPPAPPAPPAAPAQPALAPHDAHLLMAAAGCGLCGCATALVVAASGARGWVRAVRGPRGPRGQRTRRGSARSSSVSTRAAYRAVPLAPPPQPSTSRDDPL